MIPRQKLVISGSIAIDRIMGFDGKYSNLIKPDHIDVLSISVLLNDMVVARGGVAANIAYTLALLEEKAILMGSVGPDAAEYLQLLADSGIDVSYVKRSMFPTATFTVFTDAENNQVGGFYPGAMADDKERSLAQFKDEKILVVISPDDPDTMDFLVTQCIVYNLPFLYDCGQQVTNSSGESLKKGVLGAEVLIVNEYELALLSEKIHMTIEEIKAHVPICITTLGEKGSVIEGARVAEPINIPIVSPTQIADPTGAGDAYRAGFLYGYVRRLNLKTCGQLGALTAAYALENKGTQEHSYSKNDFLDRYKDIFGELTDEGV